MVGLSQSSERVVTILSYPATPRPCWLAWPCEIAALSQHICPSGLARSAQVDMSKRSATAVDAALCHLSNISKICIKRHVDLEPVIDVKSTCHGSAMPATTVSISKLSTLSILWYMRMSARPPMHVSMGWEDTHVYQTTCQG